MENGKDSASAPPDGPADRIPADRIPAHAEDPVRFEPGQVILHRHFARDRLTFVRTGYVVDHDERGLRLWLPHGGPMAATMTADGLGLRDMAFAEWIARTTELTTMSWYGPNIFMYIPTGQAHSVWWFWNPAGRFVGWYINLEEPGVCWDDHDGTAGIDSTDQDLDVWVNPDRSWQWKDEDELTERLAFPDHYWVSDEAAVRAEGLRMITLAEAGEFPFDGTWVDFRPNPAWGPPAALPAGWRRPRARSGPPAPTRSRAGASRARLPQPRQGGIR